MKHLVVAAVVCVALVSSACGGDTRASLAREGQATMTEFASVLETIKDVETAKAAKPKLKTLIAKIEDLNARQNKMPEPTEAEMKALMDQFGKGGEELAMKMQGAMMRIMFDPAIRAELDDLDMGKVGGK